MPLTSITEGIPMEYTSYQRVITALEHKEPDRVPIDLGGTAVTGINIHALRRLKDHLGIPGPVTLKDMITQLAFTDDATFERLELDVRCVGPAPRPILVLRRSMDGWAAITG